MSKITQVTKVVSNRLQKAKRQPTTTQNEKGKKSLIGHDVAVTRSSRAKNRTRESLISAARLIMATKGIESATINEITEEADVGFGSFYNHFASKDELALVVLDRCRDEIAGAVRYLVSNVKDIAQAIVFIQRLIIQKSEDDPVWGQFMVQSSIAHNEIDRMFTDMATEHLNAAADIGRFRCPSVSTACAVTLAGLISVMRLVSEGQSSKELSMKFSELMLRMYGLDHDEAKKLVKAPMPKIPADLQISKALT